MMKVQVQINRAFKTFDFIFHQKNKTKRRQALNEIFFNPQYKCADPLFQNHQPFFCYPLFFEEYLNPPVRVNKMANKYTFDYHPSSSRLTSRLHPPPN